MANLTYEWQELGSASLYSNIVIKIDGKLESQNVTNNFSTAKFRFRNAGSYWRTTNGQATFTGTFTDSGSCATYPNNIQVGDTIFEITKTVYHDNNGNASLSIGGILYAYINSAKRTANIGNVDVYLPQIARASTWNSSLLSIANIENAFTLSINKYVDSYYNVAEVRNANNTYLVKTINNAINGTSVTFSSSELNDIYTLDNNRNQLPLVFYMDLKTYTDSNKTTQVGTTQRLKCEAYIVNGNPTATYTIVEQDENVIELLGGSSTNKIIKNASDLLFTITATALKGATIKSVKVNDSTATLSSGNYVLNVNNITTGTFNIVITDSRNLTNTYIETKTIIDYLALAYNSWSIKRYSQTSSDLVLNADITCYSSTIDGNTNTPIVKYSIDNENWTTISSSDYTFQDNKITITNLTLQNLINYQTAGTFYLKVSDILQEINDNKSVPVGIYTMAKSDRKVRINGTLEIADSTGQNRKEIRDLIYPVGSIYISVNNTNPSSLFGGTWVAFGTGRTLVGVDTSQTEFNSVEKTGGEKTHTLTENELPNIQGDAGVNFLAHQNYSTSGILSYDYGGGTNSLNSSGNFPYGHIKLNFGGGQAHNILQPYITCYMWKRTA